MSADDFLSFLCEKLDSITVHSFIAKKQSQCLKELKEELSQNQVIVLVDFAENHNFLVQDEVQSYHWNSQQCTLHPVIIYYQLVNQVVEQSLCIIFDDLTHDVLFVYKVMSESISLNKKLIQKLKKYTISQMDVLDSTKRKNIFLTYAFIK